MSLDAVKEAFEFNNNLAQPGSDSIFGKWENWLASKISHHGEACCEIAREWLFAMDFSELSGASVLTGPRWIRKRYNWGPTRWQIHWCEAIKQKNLDCGAHAALANEIFAHRGVKSYSAQLIQKFSAEATLHWTQRWESEETPSQWIHEDLIYHEGNAVVVKENEIKIWDASAGWWLDPNQNEGYGALLALRIVTPLNVSSHFKWENYEITPNKWQKIKK